MRFHPWVRWLDLEDSQDLLLPREKCKIFRILEIEDLEDDFQDLVDLKDLQIQDPTCLEALVHLEDRRRANKKRADLAPLLTTI